jgi:hypothetical protein
MIDKTCEVYSLRFFEELLELIGISPWRSSRLIKRKFHHCLWRLPYTEVLVCHKQRIEVFHSNLSIERSWVPFHCWVSLFLTGFTSSCTTAHSTPGYLNICSRQARLRPTHYSTPGYLNICTHHISFLFFFFLLHTHHFSLFSQFFYSFFFFPFSFTPFHPYPLPSSFSFSFFFLPFSPHNTILRNSDYIPAISMIPNSSIAVLH